MIFNKSAETSIVSSEDIHIIQQYNNAIHNGAQIGQEFIQSITGQKDSLAAYLLSLKGGEATVQGYSASLFAVQGAGTAAAVGINAVNVALRTMSSIGIMMVISLLVEGLNYLMSASDRAQENAEEALNTYNEAQTQLRQSRQTIGNMSADYEALSSRVNSFGENVGLSAEEFDRYNQISNEIANMFPELVQGWTDEGNAILSCKGNLEELNKAYDAQKLTAAYDLIAQGSDIMDTYANKLKDEDLEDWKNSDEESFLANLANKKGDLQAIEDYVSRFDESVIRDALEGANVDPTEYWNGKDLIEAVKNNFDELINYYQVTASKINGITQEVRPLAEAYLQTDSNYINASNQHKKIIDLIIGSLDASFFAEYQGNETALYNAIAEIVASVTGEGAGEVLITALETKARFDNNELTVEEYQKQLRPLLKLLNTMDPETKKRVSVIFDIQSSQGRDATEGIRAIQSLINNGVDGDVASKFVAGKKAEDLAVFFDEQFLNGLKEWTSQHQGDGADVFFDYLNNSFANAKIRLNAVVRQSMPEIYEGIQSSASLAAKAQQEMADAGTVSLDTMMSLINAGLLTESQFIRTADGYAVSEAALNSMNETALKTYQVTYQNAMNAAAVVAEAETDKQGNYQGTREELVKLLEAKKAVLKAEKLKPGADKETIDAQIEQLNTTTDSLNNAWSNLETAESFYNDIIQESIAATQQAKWKESVDQAFRDLEHQHSMGLISEAAYLDALEQLNNRYYKNSTEYENEYQSYLEQIHNGRLQLTRDRISKEFSDLEHQHNMGLISEAAYLDKLEQLNNQYYKNNAEYESEYQSNLEQIRNGRLQLTRDLFAEEQAELQRQRDRGKISEWKYLNELEKLDEKYYKGRQDFLEDSLQVEDEILQGRLSLYQEAYDQLGELVDKQAEKIRSEKEAEKQALQEQLDALKEYYDQRKQELRDEAEQEDNLQNEAEMKQTIADLERRVNSLRLSTSAVDVHRRLELEQELADAREELEDFQEERRLEEAEKALDEEYEKEAEKLQSQIDTIDEYLENEYQVQQDALNELKQIKDFSRQSALYQRMRDWNRTEGTGKDEDIDQLFSNVQNILTALGTGTFGGAMSFLKGQVDAGQHSFAGGTTGAPGGFAIVDELGYEAKLVNPRRGRYQFLNDGDVVFTRRESLLLKQLTGSAGAALIGQRLAGMLQQGAQAASSLLRPAVALPVAIQTGDIVINGNADNRTVAALKAAQKSMTYQILKEFKKLK